MARLRPGTFHKDLLYMQLGPKPQRGVDPRVAVCADTEIATELMDAWNEKHATNPQPGEWETT